MYQRHHIFQENLALIRARNAEYDRGWTNYELRINCYGDMTLDEFAQENLGLGLLGVSGTKPVTERLRRFHRRNDYSAANLPRSVDWNAEGRNPP